MDGLENGLVVRCDLLYTLVMRLYFHLLCCCGRLPAVVIPGDKLTFDWKDESSTGGAWNTHAEVPIDDVSRTKVSVSRDWQY